MWVSRLRQGRHRQSELLHNADKLPIPANVVRRVVPLTAGAENKETGR